MAIIKKTCPSCKGVSRRSAFNKHCWRCDGHGWVEHDTTDKYYYGFIVFAALYMAFQVARAYV